MKNKHSDMEVILPAGNFCYNQWDSQGYCCRDCRYLERDVDSHGDRRCSYFGKWMWPAEPACGNFKP